jgi:hypothetical protein
VSLYRYVAEILDEKRRKPAPVQIGCSHPVVIDITSIAELSTWPSHSLLLCNSCGARWCRPRHAVTCE